MKFTGWASLDFAELQQRIPYLPFLPSHDKPFLLPLPFLPSHDKPFLLPSSACQYLDLPNGELHGQQASRETGLRASNSQGAAVLLQRTLCLWCWQISVLLENPTLDIGLDIFVGSILWIVSIIESMFQIPI
jgi:hypothetical protein